MRPSLVLLAALSVIAAPASAAEPESGAAYRVHDHQTPGDNWHVDAQVSRSGERLRTLVLHAERCGAFTPFAQRVPIGDGGEVVANGVLDSAQPGLGTWGLTATFTASHRLDGEFRFVTPDCDTGPMVFVAHSGREHTHGGGDGHAGHGRTHTSGTPIGTFPDLEKATPRRLHQARRLWRVSRRAAARRWTSFARVRAAGFRKYREAGRRRQLFHMRHAAYKTDRISFDARRPESLVYYRPTRGKPILVGFMYRQRVGHRPRFARPLLGWHSHGDGTGAERWTQMTHVWLTRDLRTALANCLPVEALEAAVSRFRLEPRSRGLAHESDPCPAG